MRTRFDYTAVTRMTFTLAISMATGRTTSSELPGQGIWIRSNNNAWSQLHGLNSSRMTVGNIDGDAQRRKDIVINFPE